MINGNRFFKIGISEPIKTLNNLDIDKLAYAVAMAETHNCTKGNSAKYNNAFGIMQWHKGIRSYKKYTSCEESYKDFKKIWTSYYVKYPNWSLAKKWTGNDRVNTWLTAVNQYYNL